MDEKVAMKGTLLKREIFWNHCSPDIDCDLKISTHPRTAGEEWKIDWGDKWVGVVSRNAAG